MNQLLGIKQNLAQRLYKTQKKHIKKDIWEKILVIQKEIQKQALTLLVILRSTQTTLEHSIQNR